MSIVAIQVRDQKKKKKKENKNDVKIAEPNTKGIQEVCVEMTCWKF